MDWSGFRIHKHTRLIDPEWILIFLLPGEAQCYVYLGLVKGLSLRAALVVSLLCCPCPKIFNFFLRRCELNWPELHHRYSSSIDTGSRMGRVNNNKKTSQRSQKMWLLDTEIRLHVHGILSRTKVKKVPNNRRQPRGDDLTRWPGKIYLYPNRRE